MKVFSLVLGLLAATVMGLPPTAVTTVAPPVITVAPPTNETGPIPINNFGPAINDTGPAKNDTGLTKNETDAGSIIRTLIYAADGIVHLGDDGVLRSFAPNLTVLAYEQLNNTQIEKLIDYFGRTDHLTEIFKGVSGFDVCEEELSHPPKNLLPLNWPQASVAPTSPNPEHPRFIHRRQAGASNAPLLSITDRCPFEECRSNQECWDFNPNCVACYVPDAEYKGLCTA